MKRYLVVFSVFGIFLLGSLCILSCSDRSAAKDGIIVEDCTALGSCPFPDTDLDGLTDDLDNCPSVPQADQLDTDADGSGDLCDLDDDGDNVLDLEDNCPLISNVDQTDVDEDGLGDECDSIDDSENESQENVTVSFKENVVCVDYTGKIRDPIGQANPGKYLREPSIDSRIVSLEKPICRDVIENHLCSDSPEDSTALIKSGFGCFVPEFPVQQSRVIVSSKDLSKREKYNVTIVAPKDGVDVLTAISKGAECVIIQVVEDAGDEIPGKVFNLGGHNISGEDRIIMIDVPDHGMTDIIFSKETSETREIK